MGGLESVLKLVIREAWQPQNYVSGALIWHLGQVGGGRGWQQRDQLDKYSALGEERTGAPISGRKKVWQGSETRKGDSRKGKDSRSNNIE